ncbi:MAG: alpha/beta fold hydrolase [Sulfitobacter sp.]
MKNIIHITALSIAITTSAAYAAEDATGLAKLAINDTRTDRPLEGFIWYPTAATDGAAVHHTNPVWKGITAVEGAVPAPGKYPLVVLSHGMYGNAMNQTWLADALVAKGYIVAAINHPGTSTWARDPAQARQMWDRPNDISRVIDHALDDPAWKDLIDPDRIFMAGHSLGGYTAVALAGGRYDAAGFEAFCAARTDRELVCGIFDDWQIAKTPEDILSMQADVSDDRIKGFAVFDLGGTQTFSKASLALINSPMLVMGAPLDISGLDLDIESRALVDALPQSNVTYLEPESLSHFDFLSECKPGAIEILAQEEPGDEIICKDGGAVRADDHALIVDAVLNAFD